MITWSHSKCRFIFIILRFRYFMLYNWTKLFFTVKTAFFRTLYTRSRVRKIRNEKVITLVFFIWTVTEALRFGINTQYQNLISWRVSRYDVSDYTPPARILSPWTIYSFLGGMYQREFELKDPSFMKHVCGHKHVRHDGS